MRLSVSVLLVTLALCCYDVKATVCPSLVVDHTAMYFTPDEFYKISLSKYKAPAEAVWGMMQVKQCTDEISIVDRFRIANALSNVLLKCTSQDL
ncbi:secretoglobin family 1D member-like [Equus przewalskii]|uniref:Uncharacterized protein n=2 Tax=Equus TaxID=9789 RepID=A0A9L0RZN3_HORSE|nr:secretoglobin family 1D member [Equus caballus]XP_008536279.1 PREDICTED: secretoglobin family 1D member-like [Equus przewalskii]